VTARARLSIAGALVAAFSGAAAADEATKTAPPPAKPAAEHREPEPVYETSKFEVAPASAKKPIKALVVENELGDVRIEGHDGPGLIIETTKRGPDEGTVERLRVSLIPDQDSGTYRIITALDGVDAAPPVASDQVRIDLTIRAPHGVHVDGRIGDGTLSLTNMDAGGELDATTGRIEVRNVAGPVIARSVDAPLTMTEVFGVVDAQVLAGDVSLDTVRGDRLSASVHEGRIDGRRVRSRQVELVTTSGDVKLEGEAPIGAAIMIASVRGTIDVHLHASIGLSVKARGRKVDLGRGGRADDGTYRAIFGKHAEQPGQVDLRTRYGDIRFKFIE
jgi:hypothetical protein